MKNPKYLKESTPFYAELTSEVKEYFASREISYKANSQMLIKISIMFAIYVFAYLSIYLIPNNTFALLGIYVFLGGWSVLVGLNIGHDAIHNAIFRKKSHNKLLSHIFDLLGTNAFNWQNRHLGAHHLYPNIMDHDADVQQTVVLKIFPKDKHRPFHIFQHLYMPMLYLLYMFRWVIYRDFKDVFSDQLGAYDNRKYPTREIWKLILFKVIYLGYIFILPSLLLDFSLLVMGLAFFLMTVSGSLVIMMVLVSTHVGEDANFPEPDENNTLPYSWSYHQVITACDFGTQSWILNHMLGGFNHHVIHHLFPYICHVHYPQLTPILQRKAVEYGIPYRQKETLIKAMFSHFKLLYQNRNLKADGSKFEF